jgi:hypothetical protein
MSGPRTVGVISDTHGLLRPEAIEVLSGSELILHAGDIGDERVLAALREIAPTVAVRGNNDRGAWAESLPIREAVEVGSHVFYVVHELGELGLDSSAAGFAAVISGHSHLPLAERRDGLLYLNPGCAGPRRFKLPITLAMLRVEAERIKPEIVELGIRA